MASAPGLGAFTGELGRGQSHQPSWGDFKPALVQEVKSVCTCQCARLLGALSAQAGLTAFLYHEGEQLVSWSMKGCLPT